MMMNKSHSGVLCSLRKHNGKKLWCYFSQTTRGAPVIWMAGVLQALIDERWRQGWTSSKGITGRGKKMSLEFGHLRVQLSFYSFPSFFALTGWVEEMRHGFITLCVALGLFSFLSTWHSWCACVVILNCCFTAWSFFFFYAYDLYESAPLASINFFMRWVCILTKLFKAENADDCERQATSCDWLGVICYLTAIYFWAVFRACSIDYYFSFHFKKTNESTEFH